MTTVYITKIEKKEVETREKLRVECDWCKNIIKESKECDYERPAVETDIKMEITYPCYGGGDGTIWKVEDLCESCIKALVVLMKQNGITVIETELDW